MSEYKPTIGLEVHAELRTLTKMFCNSKNEVNEDSPNVHICPVCMGYPGSLPVINRQAVRHVLAFGVAVGGKLADYTEFDRKNYFYPDIPKGYQISQYAYPLVTGGELAGISLTRVHLEEDTARSTHDAGNYSLLDFNRAGVPLMELVTEPVIHSALEARLFAQELQLLLIYLGASFANMEKGEMRVEANISISKTDKLGTKVEVKNLNSFKAVEKAIMYEIKRHTELLEKGEQIIQETRGWDEKREVTFSQRAKEDSHDYRYFPDPDLPKLVISEIPEFAYEKIKETLPELPHEKRLRLKREYNLSDSDTEIYIIDIDRCQKLEEVAGHQSQSIVKLASNYILTNPEVVQVSSVHIVEVMKMIEQGMLSSTGAKHLLKELADDTTKDPKEIAKENNLLQENNPELLKNIVEKIVSENQNVVEEYKKGKVASLQFLIGQAMKESKGSGNPQVLKSLFEEFLSRGE